LLLLLRHPSSPPRLTRTGCCHISQIKGTRNNNKALPESATTNSKRLLHKPSSKQESTQRYVLQNFIAISNKTKPSYFTHVQTGIVLVVDCCSKAMRQRGNRRAQRRGGGRGDEELRRLRKRDRKGRAAGRCVSDGSRGIRMRIGR
jgi:hypothetical protein